MRELVVIGGGMVGHRMAWQVADCPEDEQPLWHVTLVGEENYRPYDRVALSALFGADSPVDLSLPNLNPERVDSILGDRCVEVDGNSKTVTTESGRQIAYDTLVLATGSLPFVPPIEGSDGPGCFTYRSIDDVAEISKWSNKRRKGVVVGGGLLGLEAAGGLQRLGLDVSVVEFADRLMPQQVDKGAGEVLRRLIEATGVEIFTQAAAKRVVTGHRKRPKAVELADGRHIAADVVVIAAGVRPQDGLAREVGLEIADRGGILVDRTCRTSDNHIYAVGECAAVAGTCYGLVAPGYAMADTVADQVKGIDTHMGEVDTSTKLKLLGVDVASFGDAHGATEGALEVSLADPINGTYRKIVLSDDAKVLIGGMLVGKADDYADLRARLGSEMADDPTKIVAGTGKTSGAVGDAAAICSCNNVTAGDIRCAVRDGEHTLAGVKQCTKAGTTCGSCIPLVKKLVDAELAESGIEVSNALCEHFAMSRRELFDTVRVQRLTTFTQIVETHGKGRGCDICKPVCASILASLHSSHVLEGENAALQDTNDFAMANIQKDGTYSVVPRIPGGEITPAKLRVIADVATEFDLYTKITGGQRIDLFGARLEQLPVIWKRLVDAGFESGHAYGKALRTVKSCVGSTWCRFGVQDSVGMAVGLELRYRGLRAPHKFKFGVSGCARECAEARGKDVGVIATEKGWNLYVCGNGGHTPKHAQLLAEDLDDDTLVQLIDRFLMLYVRTADRLQRTAPWLGDMDGGIEYLKQVIVEDSLGLGEELEQAMSHHVDTYVDEWQATLSDPVKLSRFVSFVNAPGIPDPDLKYVLDRDQRVPVDGPLETTPEPVLLNSSIPVRV